MKLNPQNIRAWHDALLSGEYKQGTSTLCSIGLPGEARFCCLGVACEISGVRREELSETTIYGRRGEETSLPLEVQGWLGIDADDPQLEIPEHLRNAPNYVDEVSNSAIQLNDTYGFTFEQIAECIRYTYPEAFADYTIR